MPRHRQPPAIDAADVDAAEVGPAPSPPRRSVLQDIASVIDSARATFNAEVAFQKARALLAGKIVGRIALLALLVLALLFLALMALVMGLLLGLATVIGPWGALGAVFGGLLVLVVVAVALMLAGWRKLKRVLFTTDEAPADEIPANETPQEDAA